MLEFPGKKESIKDIYKSIAFQFGQTFSLIDGFESESYTKNSIIKNYPDLSNLIKRGNVTDDDLNTLNRYLKRFISLCNDILEKEVDYFE
jgi:HEPN domain-containing protein